MLMESRIKELLDKYWAGETSLADELEVKEYFKSNPELSGIGSYFHQLKNAKLVNSSVDYSYATTKKRWFSVAAVLAGLLTASIVIVEANKSDQYLVEDPQKAFEITKKALMMVSNGLNESTHYTAEIKRLNKAEEKIRE